MKTYMKNRFLIICMFLMLASLMTGCASVSEIHSIPLHAGFSETYSGNKEVVVSTIKETMKEIDIDIVELKEKDDERTIIIGKTGFSWVNSGLMSGVNYGEYIRVIIKQENDNVRVFIVARKKADFNLAGSQKNARTLLNKLNAKLARAI